MRPRPFPWISICLISLFGILSSIQAIGAAGNQAQQSTNNAEDLTKLTDQDKSQFMEAFRLKAQFGPSIWPGFGEARIPLILYNERYAFLVGHPGPPSPWAAVEEDSFQEKVYYRREGNGSQAFAVRVGELWAGSLDSLGHMNKAMREEIRENIPPDKLTPAMFKMMEVTPAYHIVALLHEAFHAFQAIQDRDRFLETQKLYACEKLYPFADEAFESAWNEEGQLLASALREQEAGKILDTVGLFLKVRAKRRSMASLSCTLITFERELEWLEGLAKYVEIRFAEDASNEKEKAGSKGYRVARNRLQADLYYRIAKLGDQDGDLRFYLSGAAQAMILDKVYPGWKKQIISQENTGLEDLLRSALENK